MKKKIIAIGFAVLLVVCTLVACKDKGLSDAEVDKVITNTLEYINDTSKSFKCEDFYTDIHEDKTYTETTIHTYEGNKIRMDETYNDSEGEVNNTEYYKVTSEDTYDWYWHDGEEWIMEEEEIESNWGAPYIARADYSNLMDNVKTIKELGSNENGKYIIKSNLFGVKGSYFKISNNKISEVYLVSEYESNGTEGTYTNLIKLTYGGVSVTLPSEENSSEELTAAEFAAAVQDAKDYIDEGNYYELVYTMRTENFMEETVSIKFFGSICYVEIVNQSDWPLFNRDEIAYIEFAGDTTYIYTQDTDTDEWTKTQADGEAEDSYDAFDAISAIMPMIIPSLNYAGNCYQYTSFASGKYTAKSNDLANIKEQYVDFYHEVGGTEAAESASGHNVEDFYMTVGDGKITRTTTSISHDGVVIGLSFIYTYSNGTLTLPEVIND